MRIQRIQNCSTALLTPDSQEQARHAQQFSGRASVHQVVNACFDDEWNDNTHQLGNQQTEKARHKTSFVASQIRRKVL